MLARGVAPRCAYPTNRPNPAHLRRPDDRTTYVKLLRRLLKVQAALWLIWSIAAGLVPRWVLEDLFGQPVLADYVWVRAAAVMGWRSRC